MSKRKPPEAKANFDRELRQLTPELRRHEWLRRIEAVLFASASPVRETELQRVVGQAAAIDRLMADLQADLQDRPYEIVCVGQKWLMRSRSTYAAVIQAAADVSRYGLALNDFDTAVLAAVAYHQPITRDGLKEIFGKNISRDLIGRLHDNGLITTGPRSPQRGAPYTFVTTERFLTTFDMQSLRDLPDREQLEDAGIAPAARINPAKPIAG